MTYTYAEEGIYNDDYRTVLGGTTLMPIIRGYMNKLYCVYNKILYSNYN